MSGAPEQLSGRVVLATHNAGKLAEMRELLAPFGVDLISAGELGLPEPAETGTMFSENAGLKAHAAARAAGLPAISDDSGLCVDALDGAPGLFTADWAGQPRNFRAAMERVRFELARREVEAEGARAHFTSALVVAWPDGREALFEGRVRGALCWPPRGELGFGYDPMFVPYDGQTGEAKLSFGEMSADAKHGIDWTAPEGRAQRTGLSHRARAFRKLAAELLPAVE